jgi:hypothetical protein
MRNHKHCLHSFLVAAALAAGLLAARPARAGEGRDMGIGATKTLAGLNAATFVYDTDKFHIVGMLGFLNAAVDPGQDVTAYNIGGQFLYHLHTTANSDFSLGGGLGVINVNAGPSTTNFTIEGLAQIRVFLVSNVALSASLGLLIDVGDGDNGTIIGSGGLLDGGSGAADSSIAIGGLVNGAFGITYFFK